jgi:hypothetical protein
LQRGSRSRLMILSPCCSPLARVAAVNLPFEKLFTPAADQPRGAPFSLLAHLSPFCSTRTHFIATTLADYLSELFALPALYDIAKRGIDLRV